MEPTHLIPNEQSSLIDLVFMSSPQVLTECSTVPQLDNSDHLGLRVILQERSTVQRVCQTRRSIWRYSHADFEMACCLLDDLNTENIFDSSSIEISWARWKKAFMDIMERCIPKAEIPDRKNLPWLTTEIVKMMRKRNYYYRRYRCLNRPNDLVKYKSLWNQVVALLRDSKVKFFTNLNPKSEKSFWSAVKYLNKQQSSIPTLQVLC